MTDGQLLDRFITRRDGEAFAELVRRHGPMVLAVSRRATRCEQDAEDAFQATFLVLVRKARSVKPRDLVGNWLFGVAIRTARKLSAVSDRRRERERQVGVMPEPSAMPAEDATDLARLLDRELERLPEKYRAAVVLCELEGRSRKEVARMLGLAEGTLSSRLATARQKLADGLSRRGAVVSVVAVAALLALTRDAAADVPSPLAAACVRAADLTVTRRPLGTAVSDRSAAAAGAVIKAMFAAKFPAVVAVGLVAVIGCLAWPVRERPEECPVAESLPSVRAVLHARPAGRSLVLDFQDPGGLRRTAHVLEGPGGPGRPADGRVVVTLAFTADGPAGELPPAAGELVLTDPPRVGEPGSPPADGE